MSDNTEYHYRTRLFFMHELINNDPTLNDFLNDEGVKGYYLTSVNNIDGKYVLFVMERTVDNTDTDVAGGIIPPGTYVRID